MGSFGANFDIVQQVVVCVGWRLMLPDVVPVTVQNQLDPINELSLVSGANKS